MNLFIKGALSDLDLELPEIERYFEDYKELNAVFIKDENKYDNILTNYGTEDLKFALGFLTSIYKNIEQKGYKVVNAVFDAAERYGEFELSVFYGNRILEKYQENSPEEILIRVETLRRVLNALLQLDDKLFFIQYLIKYSREVKNLISLYPSYLKDIYTHISDWYQFMYYYSLSILGDNEKAFGFLLKSYEIRKSMLENGMTDILTGNTILYTANIIGLYSQLEDSLLSIAFSPESYVKEFIKEAKLLKKEIEKRPNKGSFFLRGYFRKYYNELLTNIYVLGFYEEHREIIDYFPEIVNKDHLLMVKIDNLLKDLDSCENIQEEIKKLREEIDIAFNNISKNKQEQILYLFYNLLIEVDENPIHLLEEIKEKKEKRFKDSLLFDLLQIKIYKYADDIEKAREIAEKTKEKAIIQNNRFILNAVNRFLDEI
jgi:SepF-like predicted cell division protein (DUF552 family)